MMDYKRPGHNQPILQAYARTKKLLEHESYPGGPVPDCEDLDHTGMQEQKNQFNFSSKYVFLTDCHEHPVALWPYDPLGELRHGRPEKKWFDVINRNQADDLEKE